jgi:hypothetical protein
VENIGIKDKYADFEKVVPVMDQMRAIVHLENRLQSNIGKIESKAPAPIDTLEGDDVPVQDPDKVPIAQFMLNEKKRVQALGRRY